MGEPVTPRDRAAAVPTRAGSLSLCPTQSPHGPASPPAWEAKPHLTLPALDLPTFGGKEAEERRGKPTSNVTLGSFRGLHLNSGPQVPWVCSHLVPAPAGGERGDLGLVATRLQACSSRAECQQSCC